ncbi:MAG: response regulator [Myxococcales bacterium]|nr:response regulator [Myxococcales bacterium]
MNTSPDADLVPAMSSTPTRILVVDDEVTALMVIPEALRDGLEDRGWARLHIETALSGEEALALAEHVEFDLLVADVVMPGIDGIETFARLKQKWPHLACVVMTAHAPEHSTPIRALRLGVADYVSKPVKPEYLVETCHRQLVVRQLRRAVDDSRVLLASIIDSVDAGVVAVRGSEVLCQNEMAARLIGRDNIPSRLTTLGLEKVLPPPDGADSDGARSRDRRTRHLDDVRLPLLDGRTGRFGVSGSPVIDRTGRRLGDVIVFRDLTDVIERKEVESFKRMAAIAAHEMKNSVTGLGLVTEHLVARLEDGRLEPEETRRMARIVLDALARLDRFARSFLGFSRIPDPVLLPVSPNKLVLDAVELYAQDKGLPSWASLETHLAESLPDVLADSDLMFQVLQNLILNAVEAMEGNRRGRIDVTTDLDTTGTEARVRITVTDDGVGIPAHLHEAVFEPNVTTREAGTGLGLVIVRDIVHRHGGEVKLHSRPGEGARFHVLLPAAQKAAH